MESNNVIIGLLVLIVLLLIVGIGLLIMNDNQDTDLPPVNNTTNDTNEVINATVESSSDSTQSSQSQSSNSPKQYDDWQEDYETGEYDSDGNPIYRSVYSTSGGQSEPGIYEEYWSANGPISAQRIG